jgi:hypothetical protein
LHAGEILLRSKLGEGTCVTIRLPINCETARRIRNGARPAVSNIHHDIATPPWKTEIAPTTASDMKEVRKSA